MFLVHYGGGAMRWDLGSGPKRDFGRDISFARNGLSRLIRFPGRFVVVLLGIVFLAIPLAITRPREVFGQQRKS